MGESFTGLPLRGCDKEACCPLTTHADLLNLTGTV